MFCISYTYHIPSPKFAALFLVITYSSNKIIELYGNHSKPFRANAASFTDAEHRHTKHDIYLASGLTHLLKATNAVTTSVMTIFQSQCRPRGAAQQETSCEICLEMKVLRRMQT